MWFSLSYHSQKLIIDFPTADNMAWISDEDAVAMFYRFHESRAGSVIREPIQGDFRPVPQPMSVKKYIGPEPGNDYAGIGED
jgi:hypothetical protein